MSFVLSYDELTSYVKQKPVASVEETLSHPSGIDIKKNYHEHDLQGLQHLHHPFLHL